MDSAASILSKSPEQTRALGRCIGQILKSGLVIRLQGGLGSGKTCFVQGLARGLGVDEKWVVSSPTYTLINEYAGRLVLYHVDLYRLKDATDVETIGLWELFGAGNVVAVEWAERLADDEWPCPSLCIDFSIQDDDTRRLTFVGNGLDADTGLDADNLIKSCVS